MRERLISCRGVYLSESEDDIGLNLSRSEDGVPVTGVGLWIDRCICSGGVGLTTA